MRDLIKKILREQVESKKDAIKSLIKKSGLETAAKVVGGIDNIINFAYDGDLIKFSEDAIVPLAYMSLDGMNFYLHVALVEKLGLKNFKYGSQIQKELGKFRFGSKNGFQYAFDARAIPARLHDQTYYKVGGVSGDSGFNYPYINQRNTLGKKYRQQIFNQIIDKYDLKPYMNVKTFY